MATVVAKEEVLYTAPLIICLDLKMPALSRLPPNFTLERKKRIKKERLSD